MVRLEVIELAEPSASALEELKNYAAVVCGCEQDNLLKSALATAFDKVQRMSDVALLPGVWKVCADDHSGIVPVYMNGKVVSITDEYGDAVHYIHRGGKVYLSTEGYVEVKFTTDVIPANYARLLPVVCQYATALYDGQDEKVLNSILKQCL